MKFAKIFFWRRNRRGSKKSQKEEKDENEVECNSNTQGKSEEENTRPRSSSFSGIGDVLSEKEAKKSKKVKRSSSVGHKTTRRNSFIRWYKRSKDIGRALAQIGDDLESNHSNTSLNSKSKK